MKDKPTTPHQSSVYVLPNQPCIAGNCDTEKGETQNVSMGQNLDDIDTLLNEIDNELICRPDNRLPAAISADDTVPVITKISLTELLSSAEELLSKCCGKDRQKQPSKIPIPVSRAWKAAKACISVDTKLKPKVCTSQPVCSDVEKYQIRHEGTQSDPNLQPRFPHATIKPKPGCGKRAQHRWGDIKLSSVRSKCRRSDIWLVSSVSPFPIPQLFLEPPSVNMQFDTTFDLGYPLLSCRYIYQLGNEKQAKS